MWLSFASAHTLLAAVGAGSLSAASAAAPAASGAWSADFAAQPLAARPRLEARYTDASRQSLEILGETYEVTLQLAGAQGHQAVIRRRDGAKTADAGVLRVAAEAGGKAYSSAHARKPSRVNLYRRGPYYVEVHWLDVACATAGGEAFPAKGEVVLHCYPEKVHVQAIWHVTGPAPAGSASVVVEGTGKRPPLEGFGREVPGSGAAGGDFRATTRFGATEKGQKIAALLAFGRMGGSRYRVDLAEPLPPGSVRVLDGLGARYDEVRGCYVVGTHNPGGFNYHYYENPHHYETARLSLRNDGTPRKVYLCHETATGAPGSVEGGVILDAEGNPLPLLVQISKNFAGEVEEPFYNPNDTAFSETFVPLHLAPGETRELASLHLYQNWGNHPLKQFSSLGAWMDYYHSSTGVTETTCFVPFKFGGLGGVDIADYRPMSQRMWDSQPQHDNIAGHRFLMYRTEGQWRYAEYRGTTFRSTGPNWMDIGFDYLSQDGRIQARLDSFELPQTDELRNFIRLRCDVLQPVRIENLATDFRLLDITTRIQALRYKHAAWQAGPERTETRALKAEDAVPVPGAALGGEFPWATVYGDKRGCNSFVVRRFRARLGGQSREPAVCVETFGTGDLQLALTTTGGAADLRRGDFVEVDLYLLPYGDDRNTDETPRQDRLHYGTNAPRVTRVTRGRKLGDFPTRVRAASDGTAQFSVTGGRNAIPIIVEGLPAYQRPGLEVRGADDRWSPVPHEHSGSDGYQVFVDGRGTFGCVFLFAADGKEHAFRTAPRARLAPMVTVRPHTNPPEDPMKHMVEIAAPWTGGPLLLRFPETIQTAFGLLQIDHHRDDMPPKTGPEALSGWHRGPGESAWFNWDLAEGCKAGGVASPTDDGARLDCWFYNGRDQGTHVNMQFCLMVSAQALRDTAGERTYLHAGGKWVRMADTDRGRGKRELVHYPVVGGPDLSGSPVDPSGWGVGGQTADVGLVAVQSIDGRHVMGLAWEKPQTILSNWFIPCVHADPGWPVCGPKQRVQVRGRLYLIEGSLDDLLTRHRRDFDRGG